MKINFTAILLSFIAFAPAHAATLTLTSQAGPIAAAAPTAAAPIWGKLVLSGNTVTCYYAKGTGTPATWTQFGQPQVINFLNNPVLAGVFITSHDVTKLATGTIDYLSISPAPKYRIQDSDIGAPSLMGMANLSGGVWSLAGSGADIFGTADQFNFQPWLIWGDCTIICRITSISAGSTWAKIGIMIRDGYNSGSDYAMFCSTNGSGINFQYRPSFNVNGDGTTVATLVAPPPPTNTSAGTAIGVNPVGSSTSIYTLRP